MSGIFDQVINYTPTILASQISGSVVYKGTWDAATNSPTLTSPPAATTKGWYYVVSVAGTRFSIDFAVGDWIISNGTAWQKVDLTDSVSSVFGRTGAVAAQTGDYSASQISGLGSLATQNGTFSGTSSGTNTGDQTISISGDVTAASSSGALSATVTKINGTSLAALATGILKNTTTTGVPSIAVAADFPTLNQNTTGTASNVTGTVAVANGGTGATTASGARTNLGLGSLATQSGTFSGTSSGTNTGDQTISITGDVTAAGSTGALSATVGKINGVALIGLGTGILKNSTVTGQPSIAIASDFPTLNQNTTGTAANVTGTVAVGNGGTGATTLTGYVKGSGTTALTASSTIPNTDITGLGTMSTQAASSVTITGGSINGTAIGASVPSTGAFSSATISSPLGTASGGTGVNTTPTNGQVLIGNGTGYTANTLTAGSGITVTNASGSITIAATGSTSAGIITATVINAESSAITKGQVVYAFGATGNTMSVKLASNSAESTSSKTLGIVSDTSIAANSSGTITLIGEVSGLILGSYTDGDTLYLGSTAGSLTNTKPSAPNHLVYVGVVERANNGNGILYVKVQNGYELDEIHDVQITGTPTSGSLIIRDATNSLWKNARLTAGTNIAVTNADASVTLGVTGIIGSTNGGTGNGFTKFSGPATSEKTFTLPNSNATLLYEGGAIGATTPSTVAATTLTGYSQILYGNGSTATLDLTAGTNAKAIIALGSANQFAGIITGNSTSGQSYGWRINAGSTSADYALRVFDKTATTDYFSVRGDGAATFGNGLSITGTLSATGVISNGSLAIPTTATLSHIFSGNGVFASQQVNGGETDVGANFYFNAGAWKYRIADYASGWKFSGGNVVARVAASGAADASISWTEPVTISSTGLAVTGSASATTLLAVGGTAGTSGSGRFVSAPGSSVSARTEFGTDGTGWKYAIAKNQGGTISDLVTVVDSGYVGIGTASPALNLDVNGSGAGLRVYGTGTNDSPQIQLRNVGQIWQFLVDGSDSNKFKLKTGGGVTAFSADITYGLCTSTTIANGLIGLGGTTSSYPAIRYNGTGEMGVVAADQSVYNAIRASSFPTGSDRRFKKNITTFSESGSMIDALRPVRYDVDTTKPMHADGKAGQLGLIAQEVYEVFPQSVSKGDDGKEIVDEWGVDYSKLVPILVAELKSLRARVAQLEAA